MNAWARTFKQVQAVPFNDGLRNLVILFALDDSGALWQSEWPTIKWERVVQPPWSTPAAGPSNTRGRGEQ